MCRVERATDTTKCAGYVGFMLLLLVRAVIMLKVVGYLFGQGADVGVGVELWRRW